MKGGKKEKTEGGKERGKEGTRKGERRKKGTGEVGEGREGRRKGYDL